ncbi:ATP-grasp domain-containing protein [Roseimaritima sediminicola]|uniref:ATP-grasp domain-containing protein n=1 Tax=Roseimaritima sediminicola TaxID=2662066 RepID=UPI00129834AF|nr:ATP-grasp domain-containing protein [Roseimaritima sediminicola]
MQKATAFILGSGYNAHGLARSLARVATDCHGFDDDSTGFLHHSRLFCERYSAPHDWSLSQKREAILERIRDIGGPVVLFATDEQWLVDLLSNLAMYQEAGAVIPCLNPSAALLCAHKQHFKLWCHSEEIITAQSAFYNAAQPTNWNTFIQQASELPYPVVVKPSTKGSGQEELGFTFYKKFDSEESFREWAISRNVDDLSCDILVEEFISGPVTSLVSLQGYVDREGQVHAGQYRKLSQTQGMLGCGNVVQIEPCDRELFDTISVVLSKLAFHGFFDAEFKICEKTGKPYLIEINARPCMLNYAATVMGLNLPALAMTDMVPSYNAWRPCSKPRTRKWVWCRHLPHLIDSCTEAYSANSLLFPLSALKAWITPFRFLPTYDPLVSLADPLPILHLSRKLIQQAASRIRAKFATRALRTDANASTSTEQSVAPSATRRTSRKRRAA